MLPSDFVVLGLGSNKPFGKVGCIELLQKAVQHLEPFFCDFKVSSVYRTKPMYVEHQSDFYNMVGCGFLRDLISPSELLEKIHKIEAELGRYRPNEIRNGPRSMDVDIEVFGSQKLNLPDLIIPHPRIKERDFVLIPLLDVLSSNFDDNIREQCFDFIGVTPAAISAALLNTSVEKLVASQDFFIQ